MASRFRLRFALIFLSALFFLVQSDESCNMDFERTLQTLFAPQEQPSPQIRSLRRYLISILHNMVARAEEVEGWNTYVYPKRSLEALARAGYLHTLPEDEDNQTESNGKRSLSALAKNGQLPIHQYRDEESYKRSSAPAGVNKEMQKMLEDLYSNDPIQKRFRHRMNTLKTLLKFMETTTIHQMIYRLLLCATLTSRTALYLSYYQR